MTAALTQREQEILAWLTRYPTVKVTPGSVRNAADLWGHDGDVGSSTQSTQYTLLHHLRDLGLITIGDLDGVGRPVVPTERGRHAVTAWRWDLDGIDARLALLPDGVALAALGGLVEDARRMAAALHKVERLIERAEDAEFPAAWGSGTYTRRVVKAHDLEAALEWVRPHGYRYEPKGGES